MITKITLTKQDIEKLYNESKEWRYNFNMISIVKIKNKTNMYRLEQWTMNTMIRKERINVYVVIIPTA